MGPRRLSRPRDTAAANVGSRIWSSTVDADGSAIDLTMIRAGRARFRIRAGTKEPDAKTGASPLHESMPTTPTALFSRSDLVSLGQAVPRLATDGRVSYPMHAWRRRGGGTGYAALIADAEGALT